MKYDYVKHLALISQVGLLMAIPIFLCIFVGIWLDKFFETNGVFLIIFILLGVLSSFRNLFKIVLSKVDTKTKDKKHD